MNLPSGALGSVPYRPVVFLDTNAIHCVRLYCNIRQTRGLPLLPEAEGNSDLSDVAVPGRRVAETYQSGRRIIRYLERKCADGAAVLYAPLTPLELTCGLLRGAAILDAAEEGMLYRMWGSIHPDEVLVRLSKEDYERVQTHVEGFPSQLQDIGIAVREVAEQQRMQEMWILAQQVLDVVYLEAADAVIYACALVAEAEEVVTTDTYFKEVVNGIENPGGAAAGQRGHFTWVHDRLQQVVSELIGVQVSEVRFPKATKG